MKDVRQMSDRELADFQSTYRRETSEWKLCEQEFQRRTQRPEAIRSWIAIGISAVALVASIIAVLK